MSTYRAGYIKGQEEEEFARLERALSEAQPYFELQVLHVEPKKLRKGMFVYADGTDWDPGSGEGLYRRDQANALWVFIG